MFYHRQSAVVNACFGGIVREVFPKEIPHSTSGETTCYPTLTWVQVQRGTYVRALLLVNDERSPLLRFSTGSV